MMFQMEARKKEGYFRVPAIVVHKGEKFKKHLESLASSPVNKSQTHRNKTWTIVMVLKDKGPACDTVTLEGVFSSHPALFFGFVRVVRSTVICRLQTELCLNRHTSWLIGTHFKRAALSVTKHKIISCKGIYN